MIDLRSDTVTRPTPGMREAMAAAEVGDDVYGEDPTITAFEAQVADLLGHEAGLFCATGSLANLLGVWLLVRPGQELLCESQAHVARAELGAHAALHGVTTRTWRGDAGSVDLEQIQALAAPDAGRYLVSTAAIEVENTHNFGGGTVVPLTDFRQLAEFARQSELGLHLDGARLWNAQVASGVPAREYASLCDTVSVCFSKGLGAPVGSMLVSSAENIARARVQRKRLGGGWRQAGVLAAAAKYALDNHVARLASDHAAAREIAELVAAAVPQAVRLDRVQTNIVVLATGAVPAAEILRAAAERGVLVSAVGAHTVRAVTHLDVTAAQCAEAGQVLAGVLEGRAG